MRGKKRLKFTFLIIAIASLVVLIESTFGLTNSYLYGFNTSYIHKEKNIIEKDYFKSTMFDQHDFTGFIYSLQSAVENEESAEDDNRLKEIKSSKKSDRERLGYLKNMDFIVVNKDTGETFTNTKYNTVDDFKKNVKGYLDISIKSQGDNQIYTKTINNKNVETRDRGKSEVLRTMYIDSEIYASFPKNLNTDDEIYWNYENYNRNIMIIYILIISIISSFIVFIVSTFIYRKIKIKLFEKDGLTFKLFKIIPMELNLILLFILFILFMETVNIFELSSIIIKSIYLFTGFTYLFIVLSLIKNFDRKIDILKTSLIVRVMLMFVEMNRNILKTGKNIPLLKRILIIEAICIIVNVLAFLMAIAFNFIWLAPITLITTLVLVTKYIIDKLTYLNEIMEGAQKIKNGQLDYKIEIKDCDNFTVLAENINNIGEGLELSIRDTLRSERMKSELITNVSHDLKTPLTSIINYIALIQKEEDIKPEHIKDYVNVLDSKSKRLKVLIEDLFEASKASSGNIELNIEKIELKQLLRQAIGEMEEKISQANLDIKLNMPEDKTYINADGRRLYRVLENLLSNIAKYSLNNTRVYIDIKEEDSKVVLTMKNISSYELNFDPVEIMERFKRADESRNTEGSGLGLAISRDLVKIQGGKFDIDIDGDLFKAIIEFPVIK